MAPLAPGVADTVRNTPEQLSAVLAGLERINDRWPGAFREVRPALPEVDDDDRILWIYEPHRIGSDSGVTDPTLEELVEVALRASPD